ncbi:MAG: DNA polymerase I [Gammaproteobacteria bacterium]|nr:DNA polymerase I [Gammaproteobacteria bacterium]
MNNKPLILVDGSSYLYRAFHAMPNFSNSKGEPTGAIYGVINMMKRLLRDYDTDRVIMVFDAKGKTFRDEMYPEYKANRPSMPDELRGQIEPIHQILQAMGFPILMIEGVEADDVIGTLAAHASQAGQRTIISTGDKDMAQLVNEHVQLVNTMTETHMDIDGVVEKFGVPPQLIVDYLALIGDKVDNIPGVPSCGPKTAVKWLTTYGSLQGVIDHADEIGGKVGEKLRETLPQLPLSYQLATIKCDVPLEASLDSLRMSTPNNAVLADQFQRWEFRTWLREVKQAGTVQQEMDLGMPEIEEELPASSPATVKRNYQIITEQAQLDDWLQRLSTATLFAFDTETTSLEYMQAQIVGVSFAIEPGEAAYVPLAHDYDGAPAQLDRASVLAQLKPLLENPAQTKIGQNLKYDMNVLGNYGIALRGIAFDTMLESYVLDSVGRHDMDSLAEKHLGETTIHFEDIAGKGAKQKTFNQIEVAVAGEYAAEDADITLRLHRALWPQLGKTQTLPKVFNEIELPLVTVLSRLERNGVLVDANLLAIQSGELTQRLAEVEQQAYDLADGAFNLNSPKQIQEILFEKQGIPVIKKTPGGQPSTAEPVLQELAENYPLPRLILEHRSLAKLKSTYTDKLPQMIDANTGRVHTSYHQAVAATGRLSSSDPNLQNIPVRTQEGRRIRQAFIALAGFKVVAADYSQIELRIMAHLSGDAGLVKAFQLGEDIHRATAAEIFGVELADVSADQRRNAKAINFGLIYGMSAFGLSRQLGIERGEAQQYMNHYFERYPGVADYMERIRNQARDQGYVETLFGRRLYLPEIRSSNAQLRQYAERTAINAPMQGTAADIIKKAMIALHQWIGDDNQDVRMIMQVHDELVFEVAEGELTRINGEIRRIMEAAASLDVPLEVDVGVGNNWDEAH